MEKVLLIEDEKRLLRIMQMVLSDAGYEVRTATDGEAGIRLWQCWLPDVVVTDLKMEPVGGLEVLKFRNNHALTAPLIVITAFATVETAVGAMKQGAYDYLSKPVDNNQLLHVVRKALASHHGHEEGNHHEMIGTSLVMQKIRRQIALYAQGNSTVLITGASGTGKELVARAIHAASTRNTAPFVKKNCAAIPAELIESELFGHKRGAFTGAISDFEGAFSRANSGILFLDEVGDLPASLQPKLLNVVEEKMITPLGSEKTIPIDTKIISATNHDIRAMIADKTFREDLYYRLNTVHIHLPSLQKREGDVDLLLDYFLEYFRKSYNNKQLHMSPEALELLHKWSWPGNIRELSHVVERAALTTEDGTITPEHLPGNIRNQAISAKPGKKHPSLDLRRRERELIVAALKACDGNQTRAADKLGITRNTLRYRLKKHQI